MLRRILLLKHVELRMRQHEGGTAELLGVFEAPSEASRCTTLWGALVDTGPHQAPVIFHVTRDDIRQAWLAVGSLAGLLESRRFLRQR